MSSTVSALQGLYSSITSIPGRIAQVKCLKTTVSVVSKVCRVVKAVTTSVQTAKSCATEAVAGKISAKICHMNWSQEFERSLAIACVDKIYTHSGASKGVAALGKWIQGAIVDSSYGKHYLGETGSTIFSLATTFLGSLVKTSATEALADKLFLPLVSMLHQKVWHQRLQSGLDMAVDAGALYAFGGLNLAGNLEGLRAAATTTGRIASAIKLGTLGYVYLPTACKGIQLATQCCRLRGQVRRIEKVLNSLGVDSLLSDYEGPLSPSALKTAMASILGVCLESSSSFSSLDLDQLLSDSGFMKLLFRAIDIYKGK